MSRALSRAFQTAGIWSAIGVAGLLAACSGPQPKAEIPASGISGPNGGATELIYEDDKGQEHFRN